MSQHREQFQYTFRIDGTIRQFVETAYSEQEARLALARMLLDEEGKSPDDREFQSLLEDYARTKFRLVYKR